ncbi:MAG: hypothetical protein Q8M22_08740 [Actinomycetota bacterium]|nr:hypothetical protein [Actinomycetota bacterium]
MSEQMLVVAVWVHLSCATARSRLALAWAQRRDDDGVDEAVTKMIWLAVGIVVAMAATAFFTTKFNQARDSVPDPVVP